MSSYSDLLEGFDPDGTGAPEAPQKHASTAAPASRDATGISDVTDSANTSDDAGSATDDGADASSDTGASDTGASDARGGHAEISDGSGEYNGHADRNSGGGETQSKTSLGAVLGALVEALPSGPEQPAKKQKMSPARRRADLQKRVTALRGMARTRRAALTAQREAEEPDADAIRQLEAELEALDKQLTDAEDELAVQLERAARRADRDRDLKRLEKDPTTGKDWAREYIYDPRSDEMQRLYGHKTTLVQIAQDGTKLFRADGGEYGMVGGVLRALLAGAERAGVTLCPTLRFELTRAACWDLVERVHGMGIGQARDWSWGIYLWAKEKEQAFDIKGLPKRKPKPEFETWSRTEFHEQYKDALKKLGLDDIEPVMAGAQSADPLKDI